MKSIKIYTKSQLVLLRNLNYILGRYRLPYEILKRAEYLLKGEAKGRQGAVVILLEPVRDDSCDIRDALNLYPQKINLLNDINRINIRNTNHALVKGRVWNYTFVRIPGTGSQIAVIYSMYLKHLNQPLL